MRSLRAVTRRAGFFTRAEALAAGCTVNDIRTAVVAHAIDGWRLDLTRIHVTRLDDRSGRIIGDVVQHERGRGDLETSDVAGIRVLAPRRCVLEAAVHLEPEAAFCLLESGPRSKRFDRAGLETAYAAMHARHRMGRLQPLIAMAGSRSGSVAESRGSWIFDQAGLPRPQQQWEVLRADGSLVGVVDCVWHEWRLIVEFDGKVKYSGRFGQTGTEALFAEKQREDEIRELTGYRFLRLTWEDLANPAQIVARIRAMTVGVGQSASRWLTRWRCPMAS